MGQGKPKNHDLFRVHKFGTVATFQSFADTVENVKCALLERVFFHEVDGEFIEPAAPTMSQVRSVLHSFHSAFKHYSRTLTPIPLRDYPRSAYRGQKLAMYERAVRNVVSRGQRASDAYLNTFLKHEKILVGSKRAVPRVIQPRSMEYNVCVGRYIRPAEHYIYRTIADIFQHTTVMKGLNAFQQGALFAEAWTEFRRPAALGLDASRFDQHVSVPMLQWEHSIYRILYPDYPELQRLLRLQLCNVGFVRVWDGCVRYRVYGGRCSGDMNTAVGNCLIMCAMNYSLMQTVGLIREGKCALRLFNNGDDCVLIGEEDDIALYAKHVEGHFSGLGFIMKSEPVVNTLESVCFCQTKPVYDGEQWRMVRDPHVSCSKDVTILGRVHATADLKYQLEAVGTCGLALTCGLPVLQSFYSALRRNGTPNRGRVHPSFYGSGFYQLSQGLAAKTLPVSYAARVSFANAYGIQPDLQRALEAYYDSLNGVAPCDPTLEAGEVVMFA